MALLYTRVAPPVLRLAVLAATLGATAALAQLVTRLACRLVALLARSLS
jgi:hypothetical protein